MMTTGGDYLNNSFGTKGNQAGKRCHSLNNSADFGNRFHTSFLDGEFNTSVRFARSAHKTKTTKTTRTFILNQTKFIVNPASQFLEEMYLKYSKSLQKYFSRNKEGMKLYGNKYFENISIDAFLKTRNKSQQKMLAKMKNPNNFSYAGPNTTVNESEIINEENKIIPTNLINTSANVNNLTTNLNFNDELHDDEFFLTPLPNKSRKLLNTKKEKKDFLNAERAAVMMRTFEYTHGVRSRVGFSQYKRMLEEEKEKLIALMLKAANKIQRWWKKKKSFKRVITEKESEEDSEISKKYSEYNMILEKKRKENFINKIVQYVHRVNKPNKIDFLEKFREYAMNCRKFPFKKKIRYMKDWYNNMFVCKEKRFQLLQEIKPKMKVKGNYVYMTKNCYYIEDCSGSFDSNDSIEGKNNNSTLNENDRTNISNMNISGDNFGELGTNENTIRKGFIGENEITNKEDSDNQQILLQGKTGNNNNMTNQKGQTDSIANINNRSNSMLNQSDKTSTVKSNANSANPLKNQSSKGNTITNISNQNYPMSTNINSNNDIRTIQSDSAKMKNKKGIISNSTTSKTSQMNLKDTKGNISTLSSTSGNITSPIAQARTSSTHHQSRKKKATLNYYDQLEKVIMLQRCIKSFLQFKHYQHMTEMMEKNQRDSFGFINTPIPLNHSKELYGRRNSNLRKSVRGNQLQLLQSFVKSYAPLSSPTDEYYNKITEEQDESKDSDDNLVNYNDSTHLTKGGQSERYRPKSIKEDLKNLNKEGANSTKNKSHSHSLSMMFPQRASSKPKSKSKSKSKKIKTIEYGKPSTSDLGNINSNSSTVKEIKGTSMNLEKKDNSNMILSKQAVRNIQGIKEVSKNENVTKKESGTTSSRSTSSKGMTNYTTSTSACTIGTTNKAITDESIKSSSAKYMKPPLSNTSRYAKPPKPTNEKLQQNKVTTSTLSQNPLSSSDIVTNKESSENIQSKALKGGMRRQKKSNSNEEPEENSNENESQYEPQKIQREINSNVPSSYASTAYSTSYKGMNRYPISQQQRASFSNEMSLGYIPPFPLPNQSYFNFIVKPCTISCYVSKIRKKIFSDTLSSTLSKLISIKANNISKKYNSLLYISFHKWNSHSKQFLFSKSKLQKIIIKYDIKKQLDSYFYRWKQKVDAIYFFCELIKIHVVKENKDFLVSKLKSEDKTKICFYSHNITSVSSTVYNTNQSQHFRYYCKINKSNNENDFLIIRMSLGYKLLRMVFTRGLGHELLLKLKRRRRRNKKSKTHYGLGKLQSKRHFEFLNFNSKLLLTTSKIVKKKVYCEFYHRLLYSYLYINNNIEYDLEKSDICALIREGYKKGYFTILYNILRIRFNYCYEDSELTFNEFVERILQMKGRNVIQEEEKVQE